jgi:hypothetical protein
MPRENAGLFASSINLAGPLYNCNVEDRAIITAPHFASYYVAADGRKFKIPAARRTLDVIKSIQNFLETSSNVPTAW